MPSEKQRLAEDKQKQKHWRRWGPYLSGREWSTVREDHSVDGDVWNAFPFSDAHLRAYRWGEDGIGGVCDNHQRLCFAPAFWNGKDPILKERLFGLSQEEGNHGEDVKEAYFFLDNLPTHAYMRALYKYPQGEFPYQKLVDENAKRTPRDPEFEILDTGVFADNRYFDIFVEVAKADADDLFISYTIVNRSKDKATLDILPTLWFRNTWRDESSKPSIHKGSGRLEAQHPTLGKYFLYFEGSPEVLFTENESNLKKLSGMDNPSLHVKDAFHDYVIQKKMQAVAKEQGTKAALFYALTFAAKETKTLRFRLSAQGDNAAPFEDFEKVLKARKEEADAFYDEIVSKKASEDLNQIQRSAFAGLLWNKQYYNYVVETWLKEANRDHPRNKEWGHFHSDDVLSVPDKWEYPCFFSWDTAFQTLPLAMIDPEYAKKQLVLLTREWYMHPSGLIPASEWNFDDVNPPVHAWAAWRVYKIEQKMHGKADRLFLERVYQKLLLNFTWWVNREDQEGKNIFQGGFLGLDNISLFNRNEPLPGGGELYQSDATSWMGMYCLNMLTISLELAKDNLAYEDMASKFFEHFLYISEAINTTCDGHQPLWCEEDGFYYDLIQWGDGEALPLKVRSLVGLVPLFAVTVIPKASLEQFRGFTKRLTWFIEHRSDLCSQGAAMHLEGEKGRRLLAIVNEERLRRILTRVLDENEFLSPFGIRSLSKYHDKNPYVLEFDSTQYTIDYEPGESTTPLFGGNSNWRGPVWFPLNMLLIESLQKYHHFYGDTFKIECPTGSGHLMNLWEVAGEISKRLISLFTKDAEGNRPFLGSNIPPWEDNLLFHEYFHAETGQGLGASHQTGWTALIAKLIRQACQYGL